MRSCGAGRVARAVEPARDRLVERVDQERRLAAARDAGDAGEQAERDFGGDVLEIVAARADDRSMRLGFGGAALGDRDAVELAGEIFAGQRLRVGHDVGGRARATISPPWMPAPGPMSTT
jgi:hypothetical protein